MVNSFFTPSGPPSLAFVHQASYPLGRGSGVKPLREQLTLTVCGPSTPQIKEDKQKDGSVGPVDNKPTLHRLGPVSYGLVRMAREREVAQGHISAGNAGPQ